MQQKYVKFYTNEVLPEAPMPAFDTSRKALVHLYENIKLDPSTFQAEVSLYVDRKESFSGNVATIHSIQDEHIAFKDGVASMEVTVVTDYVPWRFNLFNKPLTLRASPLSARWVPPRPEGTALQAQNPLLG